ncbi:MAG: hypothetical protein U0457_03505 [Candidatus Sericytochromatia bacterium]
MKKILKKILLFSVFLLNFSCYQIKEEVEFKDTFDLLERQNKKTISEQLRIRFEKIEELKNNIRKIENYNKKFLVKLDFEKEGFSKTEDIYNNIEKNKELIRNYNFQIKKLKMEINIINGEIP